MTKKWWRDFTSGVIGTAIGVGLTFAINGMVENHKKSEAKRQTAMMAIYDIDCIVHQLEEFKQREAAFYKVSMFLSTNPDKIETVSQDTLWMAASYLIENPAEVFDFANDAKENAFTSSIDAFQNLDNIQFYDNVQRCYQRRHELLQQIQYELSFKRPVSKEFTNQIFKNLGNDAFGLNGMLSEATLRSVVRQALQQPGIHYFLHKFFARNRCYSEVISDMTLLNQENKLLMGIYDDDMEEYIRNTVDKNKAATPKNIAGRWENRHDTKVQIYDLQKDGSISMTNQTEINVTVTVEDENLDVSIVAPVTYTVDGQWQLEGDSLKMEFNPETVTLTSFDLDLSNIPQASLDRKRDSLEAKMQLYRGAILQQIKDTRWSWAYKVSIAKTETSMFWENQYPLPWGQQQTYKEQLVKLR